ncbi:MAG: M60 family metallopeptidase, partial [Planctomycetota bacterium]
LKDHSNRFITHGIALNKDKYHYVVEGEHIIVSMPYPFWKKCKRPVDFITQLDVVYDLYANLTDGTKPFGGNKIVILNVDNLKFHMSSGNPILSRQDRIEYILEELEKSNYKNPSWGLMHELGHDFIIGLKHRFVFGDGDNESWAEFFALYGCQKLGLEPDKEPTWLAAARAYHESGEKDFERIKKEKWMMIGFLHHIQEQYGWNVYKKLFKRYAQLVRENNYPHINEIKKNADETQKKIDVFVKELSLAAGANFYPYFDRWGFPVNRSINKELKHLPKAKLFNNRR